MDTQSSAEPTAHAYFRPTTSSQRHLLFNTAAEIDNVSEAARRAHTGRGTYYYWRPRVAAGGLAALDIERSRAPHRTRISPVSATLKQEVLDYEQQHPQAGYRTIANDINKAHGWQKVISHSKVGEMVRPVRAARALPPPASELPHSAPPAVHAPQPDETLNLDLCVVPLTHSGVEQLASVSLTEALAGALPTPRDGATEGREWPGQTFQNPALSYEEQIREYAEKRAAKRLSKGQRKHRRRQKQAARAELNAQSDELRLQRRRQRLTRQQSDLVWQATRQAHRENEQAWRRLSKQERYQHRAERRAQQKQWRANKAARRTEMQQRQTEDATWRQERQALLQQLAQLIPGVPLVTAWLVILVVVCNGTRRCLGLPLFTAGVHVTAEMIVAALRTLCPAELQFVITDNGAQFIAEAFAQFAHEQGFLHVRIAPHRACTNGIAERFIRTLKEWLETHTWNSPEELEALLAEFLEYYNNRPHQGADLDGLSPNEFARRCRDCSRC